MNDLQQAISTLRQGNFTCVLVKGNDIVTSTKPGISPMLDFISENKNLDGYSAADKIIGKAAAMLFKLAGVTQLHAEVASKDARDFCNDNQISLSYATLTDFIVNRKGDGTCPMELTVRNINDCNLAFQALLKKREELRAQKH